MISGNRALSGKEPTLLRRISVPAIERRRWGATLLLHGNFQSQYRTPQDEHGFEKRKEIISDDGQKQSLSLWAEELQAFVIA